MNRLWHPFFPILAGALVAALTLSAPTVAQQPDTLPQEELPRSTVPLSPDTSEKDAPYVPTHQTVVQRMLEVADVSENDVVFDLGSGDGRIPIAAASQFGARGVGIEIDPELIAKSRAKAKATGVADRVEFRQGDLFEADLSEASVVALYLWPEMNIKLRPKLLRELDPGDRVVSHDFWMGDWEPDRTVEMRSDTVYLWIVPEDPPEDLMTIPEDVQESDP